MKIGRIFSKIIKNGILLEDLEIKKDDDIGVGIWCPDVKLTRGYYDLRLIIIDKNMDLVLDRIFYNPDTDVNCQLIDRISWKKSPEDFNTATIILERTPISDLKTEEQKKKQSENKNVFSDAQNWDYRFYYGYNADKFPGKHYYEKIDKKFCMNNVASYGSSGVLGANCPLDPTTPVNERNLITSQFEKCLNWRRIDYIGKECRKLLSENDKNLTIDSFCGTNPTAKDCKCINRELYPDYIELKKSHPDNDYCWYGPCSSGYYLIKDENKRIKCGTNYCSITYNVDKIGGDVDFQNVQNIQNCTEIQEIPPTNSQNNLPITPIPSQNKPIITPTNSQNNPSQNKCPQKNNDNKYFIIIALIIIILFLLFR